MSLTNEQKAQYVAAIAAIWPNMPNNTVGNISDEVAGYVDQALHAIKQCSQAFALVNITFALFYSLVPGASWKDVLVNAVVNGTSVGDWISALNGQTAYQACVATTALNWRSIVEMALMGIRK